MTSARSLKEFALFLLFVGISGAFIAFSMPPHGIWWLAYVGLTPILILSRRQSPIIAFGSGLLAVGVAGMILSGRVVNDTQWANLIAAFGSLGLSVGLALCVVSVGKKASTAAWIVLAATAGVFGEWVVSHLFIVSLAISQYANPLALRLSGVTAFWGVTFVIWYVSACIAAAFMRQPRLSKPVLGILVVIALLSGYTYFAPSPHSRSALRIAAIQAPDTYTLRQETNKVKGKADIIVWPELGLTPGDHDVLASADEDHIYIAANFLETYKNGKPLNTSYYVGPDAKVLAKFRKQHLFGNEALQYGRPGEVTKPALGPSGVRVAVPTCYDTMFTDTVRNYVKHGARLILVPNCDPDAPNNFFGRMHACMTAFRAAENAVPIAVADPMSVSTIFDSTGRVVAQTTPGDPDSSILANITPGTGGTFYNRTGDVLPFLCIAYILGLPIIAWKGQIRASEERERAFAREMCDAEVADKHSA